MKKYFSFKDNNFSNFRNIKIIIISILLIILNLNIAGADEIKINNDLFQNLGFEDYIFDLKMKSLMMMGSYPSLSIYAIENNELIWSKFYGYSDVYNKIKPDKDTIYVIGSISKTITAVAIMQLYERGLLNLDDDINDYLPFSLRNPKFPDEQITFRMLLSHRSSIYDYHLYSKQGKIELAYCFPMIDNICEIFEEFLIPGGSWYHPECWLNSKPGETTVYSSFGIMVLSYLVEQISGQCIEEYCKLNIFEPLNMSNTFFHPNINNIKNIAKPYIRLLRVYIPLPQYDPKCLGSIGGIHTSIEDLSHYLIALMNKGVYNGNIILEESSVNEMFDNIYPEEVFSEYFPHVYGLVFWETEKFGEKLIGHGGGAPGYLCDMYMNISTNKGFIMFSNHCNPGSPAYNLAYIRLYPKIHIIRTTIGKIIMDRINN
jgi:CubicO group peptidase (beta-lactamase class C family)